MPYVLPPGPDPCPACSAWAADLAHRVAANADAVAIVSPRQRAAGAAVVFPRHHVHTPSQLQPAAMAGLWRLVFDVTRAIESAYDPDGMHTWHDIGTEADASMAHLTIDIVPRHYDVPYRYLPYGSLPHTAGAERSLASRRLRAAVAGLAAG